MTTEEFSRMIAAARDGDTSFFDVFFKSFSRECKSSLYHFVSSKEEAEEAFSETMYKFWKKFVVEKKALPEKNVKGYIFMMAKFYCLDQKKQKDKEQTNLTGDVEEQVKKNAKLFVVDKTEKDFLEEQSLAERKQAVLRIAIGKLQEKCRRLFEYVRDHGTDRPRDLWEPLGYKNAATVRTVKAKCHRVLKLKVVAEMERLSRR